MSDMKCPFCGQELGIGSIDGKWLVCFNCHITGNDKLWQELIRTRKALGIAVDALKMIGSGDIIEHSVVGHEDDNKIFIANKALEQIIALEKSELENLEMLVNNVFK